VSACKANWDLHLCVASEDKRKISPFKDGYFDCAAKTAKPDKVNGLFPTDFNLGKFNQGLELFKNENFCCESMTWRNQNCQDVFT